MVDRWLIMGNTATNLDEYGQSGSWYVDTNKVDK